MFVDVVFRAMKARVGDAEWSALEMNIDHIYTKFYMNAI